MFKLFNINFKKNGTKKITIPKIENGNLEKD